MKKIIVDTNVVLDILLHLQDYPNAKVDYIVTRNTHDYSSGSIPAVTPEMFMQAIAVN